MSLGRRGWRERPVQFGRQGSLHGIVTRDAGVPDGAAPFMLLLNAGVIHRVGPNRLGVELARKLALEGVSTLRFDLSGLGDSAPRSDTTSIDEAFALDVREAIDFVREAYGAERFVTLGLCSGGREAFRAAYRDPRVVGAVLIDPYSYPTWTYVLRYIRPRLTRASSWRTAALGWRLHVASVGSSLRRHPAPEAEPDADGLPERPPRPLMQRALAEVLARGTELFFIYTGGRPEYYNYEHQLRDTFPSAFAHPGLRYRYMPEADHTFSSEDARRELFRHVVAWLDESGFIARRAGALQST